MDDLQIVFSILGVLLILAIIGHGMWTIRKNDRAAEAQAKALAKQRQQRDQSGFDADGIGEVRVVRGDAKPSTPSPTEKTDAKTASATSDVSTDDAEQASKQDKATSFDVETNSETNVDTNIETIVETENEQPQSMSSAPLTTVADESFTATDDELSMHVDADERLTPAAKQAPTAKVMQPDASPTPSSESVKPEQMDLHIDEVTESEGMTAEPEEVIALHVKGDVQGDILLQQMTELGFKFGEFDIFHRHETTAGTGPVLFSLANMFNPGTFDIDAMETFKTQGVALFLALPVKGSAQQAFTMMHNAAQKVAAAIGNGQVLDEHRNPLTRQTVQHIQQRIREFERRQLLRNHKLHE